MTFPSCPAHELCIAIAAITRWLHLTRNGGWPKVRQSESDRVCRMVPDACYVQLALNGTNTPLQFALHHRAFRLQRLLAPATGPPGLLPSVCPLLLGTDTQDAVIALVPTVANTAVSMNRVRKQERGQTPLAKLLGINTYKVQY